MVFRRLATAEEVTKELQVEGITVTADTPLPSFQRIRTRAVAFVVFDRLLITVHPEGCYTARSFVERYLSDAIQNEGLQSGGRNRLPSSPADMMLAHHQRHGDSYWSCAAAQRRDGRLQRDLLRPASKRHWNSLLVARS